MRALVCLVVYVTLVLGCRPRTVPRDENADREQRRQQEMRTLDRELQER